MTILYDVVSLLRVFPSIGANLEPYSKKENGEKAITSAPNRVLRTGRRIKSVLKHVFRTFARKETSLRSSSTTKRTCLLLRSIKWLLVPRLGQAERLSPP